MTTSIIEEREELMVSLKGSPDPALRLAHFLKPSLTSSIHEPPPFHLLPPTPINKHSLNVSFNRCTHPQKNWKNWVTHMHSLHQFTWKQVGIHDAIINSTYKININHPLVLSFAEKWCSETSTFVFPWGEVTITLEDMIFLGGYSVLGDSVLGPPENTQEIEVLDELEKVRREINKSRSKKASHGPWLSRFIYSETRVEHEAFLALWLSRFVFPKANDTVSKSVLPIAVRLARGNKIALAPAVLASLYRDLRLMKAKRTESIKCKASSLVVWSPMQLVQIWAYERFPTLQFKPNDVQNGEPPFARWCDMDVKMNFLRAVGGELGSEDFCWCPYDLWPCKFYNVKEGWVLMDSGLDQELESFARCLRVSELVGIECSCIEQYLPHRVAMQFGLGQDVPGPVARANASAEIAWEDYTRPIGDVGLYFPTRFFEPCVTSRYLNWWNSVSEEDNTKKNTSSSPMVPDSKGMKMDNVPLVPPGFSPRCSIVQISSSSEKGKFVQKVLVSEECKEGVAAISMPKTAEVIVPQTCRSDEEASVQSSASSNNRSILPYPKGRKSDNIPVVPPVFSPKCPIIKISSSSDEGKKVNSKEVMSTACGSIKPSMTPPIQRPSSKRADYEAFGKGNIVQSEECKQVKEAANMPKTAAEVIVPLSFPQTRSDSEKPSVESCASSRAINRSFEMENAVQTKISKKKLGDMSESNLDRGKGESSSLDELEILGTRYEGRISKLEKLVAHLRAAKLADRLD